MPAKTVKKNTPKGLVVSSKKKPAAKAKAPKDKAKSKAKKPAPKPAKTKKPVVKERVSPSKKPVSKKPAAKKPSVKKPTAKKTIAKKPAKAVKKQVKKPAKPAVKRPAPAKKATVPPAKRKAVKAVETEEARSLRLRRELVQRREQIVAEAKNEIKNYITGENRQLVETALDEGDWSVIDLSEDISLRKLTTHRQALLKIDEALRKLREGTYGICEDCGEEIHPERLKILPYAIFCRDCQEKREQIEAVVKAVE